jgi:hypothetical protein
MHKRQLVVVDWARYCTTGMWTLEHAGLWASGEWALGDVISCECILTGAVDSCIHLQEFTTRVRLPCLGPIYPQSHCQRSRTAANSMEVCRKLLAASEEALNTTSDSILQLFETHVAIVVDEASVVRRKLENLGRSKRASQVVVVGENGCAGFGEENTRKGRRPSVFVGA